MGKIKNFIKSNKRKAVVLLAFLIAIGGYSVVKGLSGGGEPELAISETTEISKKDFVNSVSESGKVKSENTTQIYAEKSLPVKEINVKVGDKIMEGEIIARLDNASIKQQIEQKKAAMQSTNRSASVQIKTAKDKLNETVRNKNNNTHATIVSANQAVTSTFDAWKSAEKTYEDYKRSLEEGYNDQLSSQSANTSNLQSSLNSASLNYSQSQDKLRSLNNTIVESRNMAAQKNAELESLKMQDRSLDEQISRLQRDLEGLQPKAPVSNEANTSELSMRLQDAQNRLTVAKNNYDLAKSTNNGYLADKYEAEVKGLENVIQNIQSQISNIPTQPDTSASDKFNLDQKNNELENLKYRSKDIKERLAEVQADAKKYEAEAEQSEKSISSTQMEIDQQRLALENASKNITNDMNQRESAAKTREDNLKTYKKSAEDAKHAHEAALKNLEVAKINVNDEIRALQNSVKSASASADNTLNTVDLKYLNEDLNKTVIKSPISGTVTEINLIKGQAPTDYVAKIETVDRVIIESQVKEFDLNRVKVGMAVEVTSDAAGSDKVFKGKLESINPTPVKKEGTATGTAANEVVYNTKIVLEDDNANAIKPGMTVRVKYVLEKHDDVYTAPSNSIYEKNGKNFMLVVDKDKDVDTIREIEVIVKAQNDFESVIMSKDLNDNLRVINTTDKYSTGMKVKLVNAEKVE